MRIPINYDYAVLNFHAGFPYLFCTPDVIHSSSQDLHLVLTNIHSPRLQILPRLQNLTLQFRIRIWYIVEREDAPAELEQEVRAEGDQGPER
jgi:hypothetical protein